MEKRIWLPSVVEGSGEVISAAESERRWAARERERVARRQPAIDSGALDRPCQPLARHALRFDDGAAAEEFEHALGQTQIYVREIGRGHTLDPDGLRAWVETLGLSTAADLLDMEQTLLDRMLVWLYNFVDDEEGRQYAIVDVEDWLDYYDWSSAESLKWSHQRSVYDSRDGSREIYADPRKHARTFLTNFIRLLLDRLKPRAEIITAAG